jgi:hypothetical protein
MLMAQGGSSRIFEEIGDMQARPRNEVDRAVDHSLNDPNLLVPGAGIDNVSGFGSGRSSPGWSVLDRRGDLA